MKFSVSNLIADKTANTLAIFAAALVPLTVMIGSGVDMSLTYMAQTKLQNACDAGVLAGRHSMVGTDWKAENADEAKKFFDFNFPDGTNGVDGAIFTVGQDADDPTTVVGSASGEVPTSVMGAFGFGSLDIEANCNATTDVGHNDIMMVLDVTGSMMGSPSTGGGSKISLLREGTGGLYRALQDDTGQSRTRFGVVSYSHTVNVGGSLDNADILNQQVYNKYGKVCKKVKVKKKKGWKWKTKCSWVDSPTTVTVGQSRWNNKTTFRNSGIACIEERPSDGRTYNPHKMRNVITKNDVNLRSTGNSDTLRQFGRYDPDVQEGQVQNGCPSESFRLRTFASEGAFDAAINDATQKVTGGTYHDVGMLWGARFLSSEGFFFNPTEYQGSTVNKHIVFMTDGLLDTGEYLYSAHGVEAVHNRTEGGNSTDANHMDRFESACSVAKSMGMTVWVIAFDVTNVDDIKPCATSEGHFYTSDGDDLEEVFEQIGQGIGKLRLTK